MNPQEAKIFQKPCEINDCSPPLDLTYTRMAMMIDDR